MSLTSKLHRYRVLKEMLERQRKQFADIMDFVERCFLRIDALYDEFKTLECELLNE